MTTRIDEFQAYRQRMNERILEADHLGIKRFFNLDTNAYKDGALTGKTKELLGLVASAVLRCNDCIDYHLIQCVELAFLTKSCTKPSTWPWWWAAASSFPICATPLRPSTFCVPEQTASSR